MLGQGGFGITYMAVQTNLSRKVAVKEFFMKDCCEREADSSRVSIPTQSNRNLVDRFREKFIREAKMIASLDHHHIVRIFDVFEENETAYYVMEILPGGSLSDAVEREGPMSEQGALSYIKQVASALEYIHQRNTVHLDVKPSNILFNTHGEAVLIDFGVSKHYDNAGEQTSTTPVGISKGYAPLEQSLNGDVSQFKPSTDIYALGATLYYLVTGTVPPEASIVNEDGLERPAGLSNRMWQIIEKAMRPRRKDRPQTISEFLKLLDNKPDPQPSKTECDKTVIVHKPAPAIIPQRTAQTNSSSFMESIRNLTGLSNIQLLAFFAGIVAAIIIVALIISNKNNTERTEKAKVKEVPTIVSKKVDTTVKPSQLPTQPTSQTKKVATPDQTQTAPPTNKTVTTNSYTKTSLDHEWVDLGLSVKWATCNVGASFPSDNGYYFAWGETVMKSRFTWENHKFRISGLAYNTIIWSKYNSVEGRGTVDNKTRLEMQDDAARANWGGQWRMPTIAEWKELLSNCSWAWTTQDGTNGYLVSGNGKSIFLPAAGFWHNGDVVEEINSKGYYWASTYNTENELSAYSADDIVFSSTFHHTNYNPRYWGLTIRPVR